MCLNENRVRIRIETSQQRSAKRALRLICDSGQAVLARQSRHDPEDAIEGFIFRRTRDAIEFGSTPLAARTPIRGNERHIGRDIPLLDLLEARLAKQARVLARRGEDELAHPLRRGESSSPGAAGPSP